MKTLILIRHGELPTECQHRYIGTENPPLSEEGIAQCESLAGQVGPYRDKTVYVSPLLRTQESARIIFGSDKPIQIDQRLQEIDFGDWGGKTSADILAGPTAALIPVWQNTPEDMAFPGGERYEDVKTRVDSFLNDLPDNETSVLVTHGGIIMYIVCKLNHYPLETQWKHLPPRGSMTIAEMD